MGGVWSAGADEDASGVFECCTAREGEYPVSSKTSRTRLVSQSAHLQRPGDGGLRDSILASTPSLPGFEPICRDPKETGAQTALCGCCDARDSSGSGPAVAYLRELPREREASPRDEPPGRTAPPARFKRSRVAESRAVTVTSMCMNCHEDPVSQVLGEIICGGARNCAFSQRFHWQGVEPCGHVCVCDRCAAKVSGERTPLTTPPIALAYLTNALVR